MGTGPPGPVPINVVATSSVSFYACSGSVLTTALGIVVFTVPGVVVEGQLESHVASAASQRALERALAAPFALMTTPTLGETLL